MARHRQGKGREGPAMLHCVMARTPCLLALSALLLALLASCRSLPAPPPARAAEGERTESAPIHIEALHRADSGPGWTWSADYPGIAAAPAVDALIRSWIVDSIGSFLAESAANREAWEALASPEEKALARPPHDMRIDWRAEDAGPHRLSLLLHRYRWIGGAHGDDALLSVNYDLREARFLGLADILAAGGAPERESQILVALSRLARVELERRFGRDKASLAWIEEGTAPIPTNYSCFTFDRRRLILHFAKYQIGPGSLGLVDLVVPLDSPDL